METNAIQSKLNRIASKVSQRGETDAVIFERGEIAGPEPVFLAWVDIKRLRKFTEEIKADGEVDRVENITVAHMGGEKDKALMATYFFRSSSKKSGFALRATTVPASPDAWASLPTVRDLWSMAAPIENYLAELFGIRFMSAEGTELVLPSHLITEKQQASMQGFPLRKNFSMSPEKDRGRA